ncbi:MAG: MEDS domain-containing protein [Bacteroidota bacterium]
MNLTKINGGKDPEMNDWQNASTQVFWGEIAPCEHVLQIYENDEAFIDLLYGFVSDGLRAGECVITIGTTPHLKVLNERLRAGGFDVFGLSLHGQYIPLDAEETLSEFMINGWPDENLFRHVIGSLVARGRKQKRPVRAFGEMVAILWSQGHAGATVRLEHLWNDFLKTESISLYCAYPKSGFTENALESMANICGSHSKMIATKGDFPQEMQYKQTMAPRATGAI